MATKSRGESVWHRVRTLFWNATEGRLRALWRVLGALAVVPFEPPTLVRPAFTGPESLVAVAGPINTGWLLVIGVAVVAFARLRNGSFAAPFRTEYEGR